MASFYLSDEFWEQGDEIALFDMGDSPGEVRVMHDTKLEDLLDEQQTRLIYIYDFLSMWTFLIELAEIAEPEEGMTYPNLMFAHGHIPEEAPEKEFIAESTEDDTEDDDLNFEDYDSLDFDENWN